MSDEQRGPAFVGLLGVAVFAIAAFLPWVTPPDRPGVPLVEIGRDLDIADWSYLPTLALLVTAAAAAIAVRRGRGGSVASGALAGAGAVLILRLGRVVFPTWASFPPTPAGIALAGASGAILGAGVAASVALRRSARTARSRAAIAVGGVLVVASRFLPFAYQRDPDLPGAQPLVDLPLDAIERASRLALPPWASPVLWGLAAVAAVVLICALAVGRGQGAWVGAARAVGIAEVALGAASIVVILGSPFTLGISSGMVLLGGILLVLGSRPGRTEEHLAP